MKLAQVVNPWDWDRFTWAWLLWIVWFFVWEVYALTYRRGHPGEAGETLSEHIWFLRNSGGSFAFFLVTALVLWLVYHFVIEGR